MWEGIAGELHRDDGLELVEAPDRQGLVLLVEREDIVLALLLRDAEPAPLGQRQSWPPQQRRDVDHGLDAALDRRGR